MLLLSWLLLLWQLGERSLWVDEFLSLQMSQGHLTQVIEAAVADKHPPLYFVALYGWIKMFGLSDFALRFLSVVAALLGVTLMVPVTRQALGRRVTVPAVLLLCLSPAFIEFGRMTRYYVLVLALGLLSTHLLYRALRSHRWGWWLAYALSGLAMAYTFYPAVGLIGAQSVIVISRPGWSKHLLRWMAAGLVMSLGFLPWLLSVAGQQVFKTSLDSGADLSRSALGFGLGLASAFYTFSVGETLFPWQPVAGLGLLLVAFLLGLALLKKRNAPAWQMSGLFFISIVFISVVTTFINPGTPFLNVPVRGLFALPYFLLAVNAGLMYLKNKLWLKVALGGLVAVWGMANFNYFTGQQFLNPIYLTPSKEAALFVSRHAGADDLVVSDYDSIFGYYFLMNPDASPHLYTGQTEEITATLQKLAPKYVWLVTIGRDQTQRDDRSAETRHYLQSQQYHLAETHRYLPIDPLYLRVKQLLLRRNSYEHRLIIERYDLP